MTDDSFAEVEDFLAEVWQEDPPLDVEETAGVLATLIDCCAVLSTVDIGVLHAAATTTDLGRERATLAVLAGLAERLHRES
jgi:hypothetical protein